MIESRCGIKCSDCSYKDQVGCKGCVNIDRPFWGDLCPVKSCCEGKSFSHCGNCDDFPCQLLNAFAYDKEQGDDGLRILQCQKWCLLEIIEKFAKSEWDVIDQPAKAWLIENNMETTTKLIEAIKEADAQCGNCGCDFDPLYKKALLLLK